VVAELDDITRGYQALSTNFVDEAGAIAGNTFRNLGSWRDEDIATFIEQVSVPLEGIKRNAASSAIAYHEQVARVTKNAFKAPGVAGLDLSMGALRNGANVNQVYGRPFVQMRMALVKGASFTDALDTGALTATSFARTEVQLSRRQASLFARKANDNIVGYLRTLTGRENCALCYAASTQRYHKGDLLPIHPACDCGEMPIYGDSDPGQIIDQQLLDKSHEAVGQRFGIDAGGRAPDYRKIMIRDHGEMGPMLTVRGQKFTGPHSLDLVGKKMPKPKALPPAGERVAKIREKADRIDRFVIEDQIRSEFAETTATVATTGSKRRRLTPSGPKAEKALDDVLDLGKEVDAELSIRVKKRIDEVGQGYQVSTVKREIARAQTQKDSYTAKRVGFYANIEAKFEASEMRRLGSDFDKKKWDDYKKTDDYKKVVDDNVRFNQEYIEDITRRENDFARQLVILEDQLDKQITPGSVAYDVLQREEARKLIKELRAVGGGTKTNVIGTGPIKKLIDDAFDEYPDDWVNDFTEKFPTLEVKSSTRGGWLNRTVNNRAPLISISKRPGRFLDETPGFDTAVHEVGHGFEDSVRGIKPLEYAFYMRRAKADNYEYQSWSKNTEFGSKDDWRDSYTGRDYGRVTPTENYEIFTTGMESLIGGNGYFGNILQSQTVDDDFRRFILGVLVGL
tara:strand:- start:225 stop:2267 length:2043 start_codon:yes stop_codon:yes gene_type:complete